MPIRNATAVVAGMSRWPAATVAVAPGVPAASPWVDAYVGVAGAVRSPTAPVGVAGAVRSPTAPVAEAGPLLPNPGGGALGGPLTGGLGVALLGANTALGGVFLGAGLQAFSRSLDVGYHLSQQRRHVEHDLGAATAARDAGQAARLPHWHGHAVRQRQILAAHRADLRQAQREQRFATLVPGALGVVSTSGFTVSSLGGLGLTFFTSFTTLLFAPLAAAAMLASAAAYVGKAARDWRTDRRLRPIDPATAPTLPPSYIEAYNRHLRHQQSFRQRNLILLSVYGLMAVAQTVVGGLMLTGLLAFPPLWLMVAVILTITAASFYVTWFSHRPRYLPHVAPTLHLWRPSLGTPVARARLHALVRAQRQDLRDLTQRLVERQDAGERWAMWVQKPLAALGWAAPHEALARGVARRRRVADTRALLAHLITQVSREAEYLGALLEAGQKPALARREELRRAAPGLPSARLAPLQRLQEADHHVTLRQQQRLQELLALRQELAALQQLSAEALQGAAARRYGLARLRFLQLTGRLYELVRKDELRAHPRWFDPPGAGTAAEPLQLRPAHLGDYLDLTQRRLDAAFWRIILSPRPMAYELDAVWQLEQQARRQRNRRS